jgi:hypothetical protein
MISIGSSGCRAREIMQDVQWVQLRRQNDPRRACDDCRRPVLLPKVLDHIRADEPFSGPNFLERCVSTASHPSKSSWMRQTDFRRGSMSAASRMAVSVCRHGPIGSVGVCGVARAPTRREPCIYAAALPDRAPGHELRPSGHSRHKRLVQGPQADEWCPQCPRQPRLECMCT